MLPQETIRKKRDGEVLAAEEIAEFVSGITSGAVSEGQIAAFAMAVIFNNMNRNEAIALTLAMRDSGDVLDWSHLNGPVLDKHSTGGVGDNVSLMLAPAIAACGGFVPMISGRGLGHTGGTLDKFDAIPGYQTQPDNVLFRKIVNDVGCAIIGQTSNLAPADKRFYSIRDVTATVESVPLITASILSKKLAAGLQGLVLDVKCGSGAFMDNIEKARELAASLIAVANGAGLKTTALLTDMNEPLATAAGNAVEMRNAVQFLTGEHVDSRLWDITVALGGEMLVSGGLADHVDEGQNKMREVFQSGAACELFGRMVAGLGGPADFMEKYPVYLKSATVIKPVYAKTAGTVTRINARSVGLGVVALGGGRTRPQDEIDHTVGYSELAGIGDQVDSDQPLAMVHATNDEKADAAAKIIQEAYQIGNARDVEENMAVIERVG